ncbi:MAG: GH25 family lysozyme, partial [Anaerolineales bacterium]
MAERVIGTDVSFYQDDPQTPQGIDFVKMRQYGAAFAIIRAGQNLWIDRDFKVNWREAKAAGIPRGSYWFYDSRADPKKQAELWVSLFNGDTGELPLWADFEDNYKGQFAGWKHWYNFIERLKELLPSKEIGVYTAYYYWQENTVSVGIPSASLNYFKQYPLWVANYGVANPLIPKPWTTWTLWQFTDNGDGFPYGVESKNIDLNYFNGDIEAFYQRFGISHTPIPNPTPSNDYRVTASPSLRVREAPSTTAKQVGSLFLNEVVEKIGESADKNWLNIKRKDGSLTGWSFSAYLQRLSASPGPQPEPEPTPAPTPEPTPPPTNKWHRVTTASLRV